MTPNKSSVTFIVPGVPKSQGSMNVTPEGRVYHRSPDLRAWRDRVTFFANRALLQAGWPLPLDEPVEVRAYFFMPRPQRPRWLVPAVKPDLDKLTRAVGDALAPLYGQKAVLDDSRIVQWRQAKVYAEEGATGVVISIIRDPDMPSRFTAKWFKQKLEEMTA